MYHSSRDELSDPLVHNLIKVMVNHFGVSYVHLNNFVLLFFRNSDDVALSTWNNFDYYLLSGCNGGAVATLSEF